MKKQRLLKKNSSESIRIDSSDNKSLWFSWNKRYILLIKTTFLDKSKEKYLSYIEKAEINKTIRGCLFFVWCKIKIFYWSMSTVLRI